MTGIALCCQKQQAKKVEDGKLKTQKINEEKTERMAGSCSVSECKQASQNMNNEIPTKKRQQRPANRWFDSHLQRCKSSNKIQILVYKGAIRKYNKYCSMRARGCYLTKY